MNEMRTEHFIVEQGATGIESLQMRATTYNAENYCSKQLFYRRYEKLQ